MILNSVISDGGPQLGNILRRSLTSPVPEKKVVVVNCGWGGFSRYSEISCDSCPPPGGDSVDVAQFHGVADLPRVALSLYWIEEADNDA